MQLLRRAGVGPDRRGCAQGVAGIPRARCGNTPVYASPWPRCDAEASPRRGYLNHPSRHSAGQPIVVGWAYQLAARLPFERDSSVAPVDARRVEPEEEADRVAAEHVRVLVGRLPPRSEYVFGSSRAGARGYLLKDPPPEALVSSLEKASRDETVLGGQIASRVVSELCRRTDPAKRPPSESYDSPKFARNQSRKKRTLVLIH
jgi:hypothetical protein